MVVSTVVSTAVSMAACLVVKSVGTMVVLMAYKMVGKWDVWRVAKWVELLVVRKAGTKVNWLVGWKAD